MRLKIIQIGNSRGVRLPRSILKQCGIRDAVDMTLVGNRIALTPTKRTLREGWSEDAKRAAAAGDDKPLWPDAMSHSFDEEEWSWPEAADEALRSIPRRPRSGTRRGNGKNPALRRRIAR